MTETPARLLTDPRLHSGDFIFPLLGISVTLQTNVFGFCATWAEL